MSDHVAPLIFINGQDFRGAQIFTLAHEMAHIWAGQGGLSNPDYGLRSEWEDSTVEQFCNRVAAETLVLSQLGFGNCLRKRLRLLPYLRSVDAGGWQPWDGNGMWSG